MLVLAPLLPVLAACGARAPSATAPSSIARISFSGVASAATSTPITSATTLPITSAPVPFPGDAETRLAPGDSEDLSQADPARCQDLRAVDAEREPAAQVAVHAGSLGNARDPLDASTIRSVVRRHADGFMGCYQLGLGRDPTLQGRVTTRFDINPEGRVSELTIAANELPDCSVIECIRDHFITIEFPPPGNVVTVQYPLVFGHAE
jgi:hypothetical protein